MYTLCNPCPYPFRSAEKLKSGTQLYIFVLYKEFFYPLPKAIPSLLTYSSRTGGGTHCFPFSSSTIAKFVPFNIVCLNGTFVEIML
jgi:hypothetical protein